MLRSIKSSGLVIAIVLLGCTLQACVVVGDFLHGTRDRIIFSHREHMKIEGVVNKAAELKMCSSCHFPTPTDARGEEPGEPLEASCLVCHAQWKTSETKGDCKKCHTDASKPLNYSPIDHPRIFFSHARHQERCERLEDHACAYCHQAEWDEGSNSGGIYVNNDPEERWHAVCFRCHLMRTEWEKMNCHKCHDHVDDRDGPRPLSRFHHDGEWLSQHGDQLIGRPDGIALCVRCHDRGYCIDCHDARDPKRKIKPELKYPDRPDRAFIHRGDYVNRHAFEARENPADCIRCHGVAGFCKSCHEQRGLSEGTRYINNKFQGQQPMGDRPFVPHNLAAGETGTSLLQFHNGNYADFMNPSAPTFHGKTARRDAVLCATCHEYGKQTVCIDCHADTQVRPGRIPGGNPHPKGFRSAIPKSKPPCSYCHISDAGSR